MPETIQCPNCSTAYRLRPDRVHPGVKRARCLRCGAEFSIEDKVRLLCASAEAPPPADVQPSPGIETENSQPIHPLDTEVASEAPDGTIPPPQEESQTTDEQTHTISGAASDTQGEAPADPIDGPDPLSPQSVFDAMASSMSVAGPSDAVAPHQEQTAQGAELSDEDPAEPETHETTSVDIDSPPQPEPEPEPTPSIELENKSEEAVKSDVISGFPIQETPRLKIRMEDALHEHLTIEELAAMAEDGRLHGYHLVAYQSSDTWIEASKVPALRPIYNRLRQEAPDGYLPSFDETQDDPKRNLFKGLFHRN